MRLALYARVFSPEGLADFARVLARLKSAALAGVEEAGGPAAAATAGPDDPRHGMTAAGVLVYYAVARDGEVFGHHLSLSLGGRYTSGPMGRTLAVLAGALLGVPPERLAVARSENTVFHVRFALNAAGQAAFADAAVEPPPPERARELHAACAAAGRRLRVLDIDVAGLTRKRDEVRGAKL